MIRVRSNKGSDHSLIRGGGFVSELLPVAFAVTGAGEVEPDPGWLYCNGFAVSRAKFKRLFNIIGTAYGVGDGSTTFNLPDYRGRSISTNTDGATGIRINNSPRGKTGGWRDVTLTKAELPSHVHAGSGYSINGGSHSHSPSGLTVTLWQERPTGAVAGAQGVTGGSVYSVNAHGSTTSDGHVHLSSDFSGISGSAGGGGSHTNVPPSQAAGAVLIRY